jgi:hypothetical protein
MEDLTYKMEHVCVMDIKMGTQTWTDDAFYLKKLQLQNKDNNTTSATMGFRITGMRVWHPSNNTNSFVSSLILTSFSEQRFIGRRKRISKFETKMPVWSSRKNLMLKHY